MTNDAARSPLRVTTRRLQIDPPQNDQLAILVGEPIQALGQEATDLAPHT
ncbi:MAG: hypothetical protein AB7O52_19875 [Planctomycetota bacterium]